MAKMSDHVILLDGAIEPDLQSAPVGGGVMIAYTCRSPDKETENEDTVAVIPWGPQAAVLVVADGAGGLPAGKRASLMAVQTLVASLQMAMAETMLLRNAILNGIEAANAAVIDLASGSATTLTVVTIEGLIARAYQIGDSEAMVVGQRGRLKSQTTAHSPTGLRSRPDSSMKGQRCIMRNGILCRISSVRVICASTLAPCSNSNRGTRCSSQVTD